MPRCFNIQKESIKHGQIYSWATNVKQIMSNFLLKATCVNYKPNSFIALRLTRSDMAQLDFLAKLLIIFLVNNCKLLLAVIW